MKQQRLCGSGALNISENTNSQLAKFEDEYDKDYIFPKFSLSQQNFLEHYIFNHIIFPESHF